jgi:hypothetical protein
MAEHLRRPRPDIPRLEQQRRPRDKDLHRNMTAVVDGIAQPAERAPAR